MRKMLRRVLIGVAVIVGVVALGYGALVLYVRHSWTRGEWATHSFDQSAWLALSGSDDPDNARGHMAADVRRLLAARRPHRREVLELLGTPDADGPSKCLSYNVGHWSGLRMDPDTLDVCFDERGSYKASYLVQH